MAIFILGTVALGKDGQLEVRRYQRAGHRSRWQAEIEYFNIVLAKPFQWTYTGKALQA
jgi:hypothetical protein